MKVWFLNLTILYSCIFLCVFGWGCVCVCVCGSVAQSCPALWNPMDCSPPGSSFHGIFQARILELIAIFYFKGSSQPRDRTHVSFIFCFCIVGRFFTTAPPCSMHSIPGVNEKKWLNEWVNDRDSDFFSTVLAQHLTIVQPKVIALLL